MITRINSVMNQLILAGSAVFGKLAAASAAVHLALSQPSTLVEPSANPTGLPGAFSILNERPDLVRKSCARSQSENFDHGPTKIWRLQVDWSAVTVIGFFCWNASRSGFT